MLRRTQLYTSVRNGLVVAMPVEGVNARCGRVLCDPTPEPEPPADFAVMMLTITASTPGTLTQALYTDGSSPLPAGIVVDWGDGSPVTTTDGVQAFLTHDTVISGAVTLTPSVSLPTDMAAAGNLPLGFAPFAGVVDSFAINDWYDAVQLWATLNSGYGWAGFGSLNMGSVSVPETLPPAWTDLSHFFNGVDDNTFSSNIGNWDTSNVTHMNSMFQASSLNPDISGWDTSSVVDMSSMFLQNAAFNQDISGWDTSSVTNMQGMFWQATSFNQDISGWIVSNVTNTLSMFRGASAFNQDISSWDVSNVTDMSTMFMEALAFNQDISGWDVSSVTIMTGMFDTASTFNQDLSGWCVSLIPAEPSNFDTNANAWVLPQPVWGTCP